MVANRIFQSNVGPIVEETLRDGQIPERRGAELVSIRRIIRDLLQSEIFILAGTVKHHVAFADAKEGRNLRNASHALLEIGKHLVGFSGNGMALHASGLAEE